MLLLDQIQPFFVQLKQIKSACILYLGLHGQKLQTWEVRLQVHIQIAYLCLHLGASWTAAPLIVSGHGGWTHTCLVWPLVILPSLLAALSEWYGLVHSCSLSPSSEYWSPDACGCFCFGTCIHPRLDLSRTRLKIPEVHCMFAQPYMQCKYAPICLIV